MNNEKSDLGIAYGQYDWLKDEQLAQLYKQELVNIYEQYYVTKDKSVRQSLYNKLEVYLSIVCDIIAYRYLVKYYSNLFHKLCITVEDYMEYKVDRLLVTLKDKKEHVDDILSYIYMSFMLSSPRLIYDYGEKIGRCQIVRKTLPYYLVARNKFFGHTKSNTIEHVMFNVDTLYLDDTDSKNTEILHSNLDRYSYRNWKDRLRTEEDGINDYNFLILDVETIDCEYESSRRYLLNLLKNWKSVESDYQITKNECNVGNSYSLIDYVVYKYNMGFVNLTKDEYMDVLKILNKLISSKGAKCNETN